MKLGRLYNK
jgi:hypothetical protein